MKKRRLLFIIFFGIAVLAMSLYLAYDLMTTLAIWSFVR